MDAIEINIPGAHALCRREPMDRDTFHSIPNDGGMPDFQLLWCLGRLVFVHPQWAWTFEPKPPAPTFAGIYRVPHVCIRTRLGPTVRFSAALRPFVFAGGVRLRPFATEVGRPFAAVCLLHQEFH